MRVGHCALCVGHYALHSFIHHTRDWPPCTPPSYPSDLGTHRQCLYFTGNGCQRNAVAYPKINGKWYLPVTVTTSVQSRASIPTAPTEGVEDNA